MERNLVNLDGRRARQVHNSTPPNSAPDAGSDRLDTVSPIRPDLNTSTKLGEPQQYRETDDYLHMGLYYDTNNIDGFVTWLKDDAPKNDRFVDVIFHTQSGTKYIAQGKNVYNLTESRQKNRLVKVHELTSRYELAAFMLEGKSPIIEDPEADRVIGVEMPTKLAKNVYDEGVSEENARSDPFDEADELIAKLPDLPPPPPPLLPSVERLPPQATRKLSKKAVEGFMAVNGNQDLSEKEIEEFFGQSAAGHRQAHLLEMMTERKYSLSGWKRLARRAIKSLRKLG